MDLTVLIPALNEASNLKSLLPDLARVLRELAIDAEILVVDGGREPETRALVERAGARCLRQASRGYGRALAEGFEAVRSEYVLTMDADGSHDPETVRALWSERHDADLLVASRYVSGGGADCGAFRAILSRLLNGVYRRALRLPFRDLSSGFRLYRVDALRRLETLGREFDFLPEVLVRLHVAGLRIREVPFRYRPRRNGHSRVKLFRFGWAYWKTLLRMKRLRALASPALSGPEARGGGFDGREPSHGMERLGRTGAGGSPAP